ncbi:MAG TPA: class II aldolase/adducin family protein [Bacteroidales bacterium]|nr:class II aldolase/adducin family protein [Bacteroidales bacterium]
MKKEHKRQKKEVAYFMRRLYKQGLTTTFGGNISVRLSDEIILITPSSTDKATRKWKDIGVLTINGDNLTPELKPSMEAEMHLNIYRSNAGIKAVVHAHPVFSSAFTALNCPIDATLTAETASVLERPEKVPYALMGTPGLAKVVAEKAVLSSILLLENHGIIATGSNLLHAFNRIEVLENAAKMTVITTMMKKKSPLSRTKILEIEKLFK